MAIFLEGRIKTSERTNVLLRIEGFNLFNHANILGRGQTIYGDTGTPNPTFGQLVAVGHDVERDPGVREHRSAADVPVAGPLRVLEEALSLRQPSALEAARPPQGDGLLTADRCWLPLYTR